jgi:hypothetical protein
MKKVKIKTYEMGESLFSTLIFLVLGILLIILNDDLVKWALYIFGSFITLLGIFKLLLYYKDSNGQKKEVINGGVYIIFGMTVIIGTLAWFDGIQMILGYALAVYLLYIGINRLISAFKVNGDKTPHFINAGIIIFLAVLIAIFPMFIKTNLILIGVFIVLYAIADIVGFILGRKNGTVVTTVVKEAVIVDEKLENKKEDDVKLLK